MYLGCAMGFYKLTVRDEHDELLTTKHCYHFGRLCTNQHQAARSCRHKSSQLAEFQDPDEFQIVTAVLDATRKGS